MGYHRGVARDSNGNAISGASVSVLKEGTTTADTIYSDAALSVSASNPITTGASGVYEFYVPDGIYDLTVAATGFTTVSLNDVVIGSLYAGVYTSAAAAVAQSTSYLTIANGTWSNNLISRYSFGHVDGAITYLGDAKTGVLVTYDFSVTMDADADVTFAVEIDGTEVAATDKLVHILTASAPVSVSGSYLVEVEKDEVITIGAKVGAGTPDMTLAVGSSIIVMVL